MISNDSGLNSRELVLFPDTKLCEYLVRSCDDLLIRTVKKNDTRGVSSRDTYQMELIFTVNSRKSKDDETITVGTTCVFWITGTSANYILY
jgi:hypothetical protein